MALVFGGCSMILAGILCLIVKEHKAVENTDIMHEALDYNL
jgi:hypothetical protein